MVTDHGYLKKKQTNINYNQWYMWIMILFYLMLWCLK